MELRYKYRVVVDSAETLIDYHFATLVDGVMELTEREAEDLTARIGFLKMEGLVGEGNVEKIIEAPLLSGPNFVLDAVIEDWGNSTTEDEIREVWNGSGAGVLVTP